jgi:hypothetical protein
MLFLLRACIVTDKGSSSAVRETMAQALERSEKQRVETIKFIVDNYSSFPKDCVRAWKLLKANPKYAGLLHAANVEPLNPDGTAGANTVAAANAAAAANTIATAAARDAPASKDLYLRCANKRKPVLNPQRIAEQAELTASTVGDYHTAPDALCERGPISDLQEHDAVAENHGEAEMVQAAPAQAYIAAAALLLPACSRAATPPREVLKRWRKSSVPRSAVPLPVPITSHQTAAVETAKHTLRNAVFNRAKRRRIACLVPAPKRFVRHPLPLPQTKPTLQLLLQSPRVSEPAWVTKAFHAAAQLSCGGQVNVIGRGGESVVFQITLPASNSSSCAHVFVAKCMWYTRSYEAEVRIGDVLANGDAAPFTRQIVSHQLPTDVLNKLLREYHAYASQTPAAFRDRTRTPGLQLPAAVVGPLVRRWRVMQALKRWHRPKHPPLLYRHYAHSLDAAEAPSSTCRKKLLGEPLDVKNCCKLALFCLQALAAYHKAGVLHGDIKPPNILVDYANDTLCVVLSDHGHSLLQAEADDERHRFNRGTPTYRAPEVKHNTTYTAAADVFSMGCALVDVITGKRPRSEHERSLTPERRDILKKWQVQAATQAQNMQRKHLANLLSCMIDEDALQRRSAEVCIELLKSTSSH